MLSGWYNFFWREKNFHIHYSSRNRAVAAVCFFLLLFLFVFFQMPGTSGGTAGFLLHPVSLFFFGVVEIFLAVLFTLTDTFIFEFGGRKVRHYFGFMGLVRKRAIPFADIQKIEVQQVVKESFLDALQPEARRKTRKYYQLNFTTRSGVHYQIGVFDDRAFRTLIRISEDVRTGGK